MSAGLDYRSGFLCVLVENGIEPKKWFPISGTDYAEVQALLGRPVTNVNLQEGIYVDEEGNVFQLLNKGETKPIEVEHLPGMKKRDLEALPEASLNEKKTQGQNKDSKKVQRKNPNNGRKRQVLPTNDTALQLLRPETTAAGQRSADAANGAAPVQLNLRQKLAEVRRRIGYIQKRGHNERFNYSYVTAADIAGSVGDILAELGVVVIPSLEEISYESAAGRGEATRMARVIMAYTFVDADTGEEVVATAAGQGLDAGDKGPYKAMTGALKYALLQLFLLATGDDPEDERLDARLSKPGSGRAITAEQVRDLEKRIQETGTDLQRLLAYYQVASLSGMTEFAYRVAVKVLNRKLAKQRNQETVHAQDWAAASTSSSPTSDSVLVFDCKPERDTEPRYIMKRSINKNEYCQGELGKVRGLEMARAAGKSSAADRLQQEVNTQKIDWLAAAIAHMDGISVAAKKLKVSRGTIYHWLDEGLARASLGTVVAIGREGNTPIKYLISRLGPFKPIGTTTRHSANGIERRTRGGQR